MTLSLHDLEWRGLLYQMTNRAAIESLGEDVSFYSGYDPSAISLQIGNLAGILSCIRLAKAGLRPLILFGGATGRIGDPSWKTTERELKSEEEVETNLNNHQRLVRNIFERLDTKPEFVDNYTWTKDVSVLDFLREVGKCFTVNHLLAKDHVSSRLDGDGISYAEFSYILLQAFDFLHLAKSQNCRLQIGGSDQWGNMTAGLDLIRKKLSVEAHVLSFPLITNAQGQKFGKSADGAVWLDANCTSPYKFHQYWLNVEDSECEKLLKVFTFLSQEAITLLAETTKTNPGARQAQKALADAVCDIVHGVDATAQVKRAASVLFGGSLEGLSRSELLDIFAETPSIAISKGEFSSLTLVNAFVKLGLAKSNGEVRRLAEAGGAYCLGEKISDGNSLLKDTRSPFGDVYVLRSGKKNFGLVKIV